MGQHLLGVINVNAHINVNQSHTMSNTKGPVIIYGRVGGPRKPVCRCRKYFFFACRVGRENIFRQKSFDPAPRGHK